MAQLLLIFSLWMEKKHVSVQEIRYRFDRSFHRPDDVLCSNLNSEQRGG